MESTTQDPGEEPRRSGPWWAAQARDVDPRTLRFPPGFRWGATTSAHQVEGGTAANTWSAWELTNRPNGTSVMARCPPCGRAADQWDRFDDDVALMRRLGLDMYRFSVEWSRVEPLRGHIDEAALERYRAWCLALVDAGIAPVVTLHHFTDPAWLAEAGGFAQPSAADAWLSFVRRCIEHLGDVVVHWVTVNEPVVYAIQGWLRGEWPPGRREPAAAAVVLENLLVAHSRAYRLIHDADREGHRHRVGLAHHIVPLRPERPLDPRNRLVARDLGYTYNWAVPDALRTGVLRLRLPGLRFTARHRGLRDTQDFLGVTHHHRALVAARPPAGEPFGLLPLPGERDDLGRSMEPSSLGDVLRGARRYDLPMIVTGHGTADGATPDLRRRRFLGACLAEVARAIDDGADVRGYLHSSLLDGYEWMHGYGARCGLFQVDRHDFHRTATASAGYYREVVAAQQGRRPPPRAE